MGGDNRDDPTELSDDKPALIERRRPGRVRYTNQALIALLRGTSGESSETDKGSPTRGIIVGLTISTLLWGAVGVIVWIALRRR